MPLIQVPLIPGGGVLGSRGIDAAAATVWVRERWSDSATPWRIADYLEVVKVGFGDIHNDSQASFVFRYGNVAHQDQVAHEDVAPLEARNLYVCVQVPTSDPPFDPITLFVGVIPHEQLVMGGTRAMKPHGEQTLTAFGLTWLLGRRRYVQAPVIDPIQGGGDTDFEMINRVPVFNRAMAAGRQLVGNRSANRIVDSNVSDRPEEFGFSIDGEVWTHIDVIRHLLAWTDEFDTIFDTEAEPHFLLSVDPTQNGGDPSLSEFVDAMTSVVRTDGRSVLAIVRELLPRKRGLSAELRWSVDNSDGLPFGILIIHVVSLVDVQVPIGSRILPPNANTATITFDTDNNVDRATVKIQQINAVERIVAKGEPMQVCFSSAGEVLAAEMRVAAHSAAWDDVQHIAYQDANDAQRRRPKLDRVFRAFRLGRLDEPFDWLSEGGSPIPLMPLVAADGAVSTIAPSQTGGLDIEVMDTLPFEKRSDILDEVGVLRFERPFALVEILDEQGAGTGVWIDVSNPPDSDEVYASGQEPVGGDTHSANVRPSDRLLEMDVKFDKAAHVLGKNTFSPTAGAEPKVEAVFDFTRMILTWGIRTDFRPQVSARTGVPGRAFSNRVLEISVPDAHVWVVATGTVVGVTNTGALAFYSGPRVVRNDMDRIREAAELAAIFFGTERATLELTKRGVIPDVTVGMLVNAVTNGYVKNEINTVVSSVEIDFKSQTHTVRTSHVELELRR